MLFLCPDPGVEYTSKSRTRWIASLALPGASHAPPKTPDYVRHLLVLVCMHNGIQHYTRRISLPGMCWVLGTSCSSDEDKQPTTPHLLHIANGQPSPPNTSARMIDDSYCEILTGDWRADGLGRLIENPSHDTSNPPRLGQSVFPSINPFLT